MTEFANPEAYLSSLPESQQPEARAVYNYMSRLFPDLEQHMYGSIIGFGRDKDGWALVAMCARKGYTDVYGNVNVLDAHARELGKLRTGKSCLSVKHFERTNLDVLQMVLLESVGRAVTV